MQVSCEIEFFGGPVDGHIESMVLPLQPFLGVKTLADEHAASWLIRMVRMLRGRQPSASILLAVYELAEDLRSLPCYRYLGTQAVTSEQLRGECGLSQVVQQLRETSL